MRIIRACHELGIEAVAVFSDADAASAHVRAADEAVRIGPAPAAESYLRIDAILDAARADRCRGDPPRLRVPRRAGGVRPRRGGCRPGVHRTEERIDRGPRRQARGAPRSARCGRPDRAGNTRIRRRSTGRMQVDAIVAEADGHRVSAAGQGGCRWRGTGHAPGHVGRGAARGPRRRIGRGPLGLRRRLRLPGARDPAGPSRRGPAHRRRRRSHRRPRRAGLLAPAPPPEARRGVAGAGPRRRPAPRAPRRRGRRRGGGRPRQRGDRRVPARPGRPLLVPRGEHPPPGRARRDRAGRGRRHRPRAALVAAGRPLSARRPRRRPIAPRRPPATRSRCGSPPRTRPATSSRRRAGSVAGRCRPGRASASTRRTGRAIGSRPTTTRSSRSSWSSTWTGPRRSPDSLGPSTRSMVTGIQTTLPFHRFVARHDGFRAGDLSTDWVADEWSPIVEADPGPSARGGVRGRLPRCHGCDAGACPGPAARPRPGRSDPARPGRATAARAPSTGGRDDPGHPRRADARLHPALGPSRSSWPRTTRATVTIEPFGDGPCRRPRAGRRAVAGPTSARAAGSRMAGRSSRSSSTAGASSSESRTTPGRPSGSARRGPPTRRRRAGRSRSVP